MDQREVLDILQEVGAVVNGHFVYNSGMHGKVYINKDALYPHVGKKSRICRAIAAQFKTDGVEVVIGPAIGGLKLSDHVAENLSYASSYEVLSIYAEKETVAIPDPEGTNRRCYAETGEFIIKRDYDKLVLGQRVLVVEDILTTGGSAKKVVEAVRKCGGNVVGVGVIFNRGGITRIDVGDVPQLISLVTISLESWSEEDCPLCKQGIPINTEVGKGREFLALKGR